MKILLNKCYGGFGIKDEILSKIWSNVDDYISDDEMRVNADLIAMKESGKDVEGGYSKLVLVEVPDTATDWTIIDYDGMERLIAVENGKLVFY